jgi:hypothetical protein
MAKSQLTADCIISACGVQSDVEYTKKTVKDKYGDNVRFFIYDKCDGLTGNDVISLPNRGREQHTYTHHVSENYDDLSDVVIFTPANIRHRASTREGTLRSTSGSDEGFICAPGHGTFEELKQWKHPTKYENRTLDPAEPRGVEEWSKAHIGRYAKDPQTKACRHGTFITSRELIHTVPQEVFLNVTQELDEKEPEAGHYMERLVPVLFGNR